MGRSAEGAREILSRIAGSTITIAGVVFHHCGSAYACFKSIRISAAAQIHQEPPNQWVMGAFIGTFVYSLLILPAVRSVGDQVFVPHLRCPSR